MTAWLRVELNEEQQPIVNAERDEHPQEHVRRKMLVLWLLHHGITRDKAAVIAGLGRANHSVLGFVLGLVFGRQFRGRRLRALEMLVLGG